MWTINTNDEWETFFVSTPETFGNEAQAGEREKKRTNEENGIRKRDALGACF